MKTAFVTGGSGFLGRNLIPLLRANGWRVRALGRSKEALETVRALGAEGVEGDLSKGLNLAQALKGCEVVLHAAAFTNDWGSLEDAWEVTVEGTTRLLEAARSAGVPRFLHVSTEALLLEEGRNMSRLDETAPYPRTPLGIYAITKGEAEKRVLAANGPGFATIAVRPRFIWGAGDTMVLPKLVAAARKGALQWIDGSHHLTSTCHVSNVCEGILKAIEKGRPGGVYFLTDGEPVEFRAFVSAMLRSQGVEPPTKEVPYWLAHLFARVTDALWRVLKLKGQPPVPHASFHLIGQEITVVDTLARRELGYQGLTTVEQGLAEMMGASSAQTRPALKAVPLAAHSA